MKRGEVWMIDLGPAVGSEAANRRPGVIVSNDEMNSTAGALGRGVLTVVPVTSNVTRVYPFQVLLGEAGGLTEPSKAQAEQVRAVDVQRFVRQLGRLSREELAALDQALAIHLDLESRLG